MLMMRRISSNAFCWGPLNILYDLTDFLQSLDPVPARALWMTAIGMVRAKCRRKGAVESSKLC